MAEAVKKGIKNIWMQPGAEDDGAIQYGMDHGINIIAGGPVYWLFWVITSINAS